MLLDGTRCHSMQLDSTRRYSMLDRADDSANRKERTSQTYTSQEFALLEFSLGWVLRIDHDVRYVDFVLVFAHFEAVQTEAGKYILTLGEHANAVDG